MSRPFLKWLGGKAKLTGKLLPKLKGKRLVEPFVGAGGVFLNSEYDEYLLADTNLDLINLYKTIALDHKLFIDAAKKLWTDGNDSTIYYKRRNEFNTSTDIFEKATLFLYLNRHGYNGLCRYNLKGGFNVPFGFYVNPYFPEDEIIAFSKIAHKCTFKCQSYTDTFKEVKAGDAVYCDPPYISLTPHGFVTYTVGGFNAEDHAQLATEARNCKVDVIVSNHDLPLTRELYVGAEIETLKVQRNVSCKVRVKAEELIATFKGVKDVK